MKRTTIAVLALMGATTLPLHAEEAAGSSPWGSLLGAAANLAAQRAGVGNNALAQQAAAAAANAATSQQSLNAQQSLALALATQSGQSLTPAQQQALMQAYAQAANAQAAGLTPVQQQALLRQGLTPAQIQALGQMQTMTPAQTQAIAQASAQVQQQAAAANCQPAQSKTGGLGGMFGKMAGGMLKSGLIPGMGADTAQAAAALAENAGAMADCMPAK